MLSEEYRKPAINSGGKFGRKLKLSERQLVKTCGEPARGNSCRANARDINAHHSTISRLR
jgi:IS30 family transposase